MLFVFSKVFCLFNTRMVVFNRFFQIIYYGVVLFVGAVIAIGIHWYVLSSLS